MVVVNYLVTINLTVPVEEEPFDGTTEELESLAQQVGDAVFHVVAARDVGNRIRAEVRLPGRRSVAGKVDVTIEDTQHPAMRRVP